MGNLTGYLNTSGTVVATYEYNAYGQMIASGGSATSFAFGFATQYTDHESGLIYYGMRYYQPKHGRFINRDPIEEAGGLNLYSFVGNSPANGWDVLGLDDHDVIPLPEFNVDCVTNTVTVQRGPCTVTLWFSVCTSGQISGEITTNCVNNDGPNYADNNNQGGNTGGNSSEQGSATPAPKNNQLSKKECDDLAAKIGNNLKGLAGMVDSVSRESLADRIMSTVMEGLDQSMPYSDVFEDFAEGSYRLGKTGLDAAGARSARKALTKVYAGGGAKVVNAVGVVNNVWDVAQVGRAVYNRDGLGFVQSSAGLALNFVTAVPALKMAISGFKFMWDGESQRALNDIEMADLSSIAAHAQRVNLNAMIGIERVEQWRKEYVDGGCK